MSADAIFEVTQALGTVLEAAVGPGQVYVGPPVETDVRQRRVALFLFHIEPNRDLRNAEYLVDPATGDQTDPLVKGNVLPLDLRYLVSVFRVAGNGPGAEPNELTTLGQIMQRLHAEPVLAGSLLPDQQVRLTPEPYPMEELSRVWGLFPQTSYRTSVVYLATPVFVSTGPVRRGEPVIERVQRTGPVEGDDPAEQALSELAP